jgi:hypothetical protein
MLEDLDTYKWREIDMLRGWGSSSNIEGNKIKHLKIPFKFKYVGSDVIVTVEAYELLDV